jgi:protein-tyrosine phosphatase
MVDSPAQGINEPLIHISTLSDLLQYLPQCIEFIQLAMREGTGILIHWYVHLSIAYLHVLLVLSKYCSAAGVSRSCAVLAAYLMFLDNITAEEGTL